MDKYIIYIPTSLTMEGKEKTREGYKKYIQLHKEYNKGIIGDLDYLLQDGYHVRCSGRSTLIALSTIEKAIANPGAEVEYKDHSNYRAAHEDIRRKVRYILELDEEYSALKDRFSNDKKTLRYN